MNIGDALFQRIGNPLEWSSGRKANLLLWSYLLTQLMYIFALELMIWVPAFAAMINMECAVEFQPYFLGLPLLTLALIGFIHLAQVRKRDSALCEYLATLYFGVSHIYYGYSIGLMSLPVGVVLAGAPVVGFIFVDRRAVATAFVCSVFLLATVSYFTYQAVLPYAPLAQNLYLADGGLSPYWTIAYGLLALPQLLFIFGLAYFVLQRWRLREQEALMMSRTDALTGLLNRRYILHVLEELKINCDQTRSPLAVVMVDLDHFKKINDRWGHDVGDQALVLAARALRTTVRLNDHVGRYGGEEFLVLLPGLEAEQAKCLAERIRTTIAAAVLELPDGESLSLSASLGMSCYSVARLATVNDLVKQADVALYQAKDAGRDQLVIAA